jgi:four helix bundle protein
VLEDWIEGNIIEEEYKPYNIKHRCFYFSKEVVLFVRSCKYEQVFNSLFDQLVRSSTSIGANVVEGASGSSKKDWIKFLIIALKSANETKYWLCLIRDTMQVSKEEINKLIIEAEEISKIIASIIVKSKSV